MKQLSDQLSLLIMRLAANGSDPVTHTMLLAVPRPSGRSSSCTWVSYGVLGNLKQDSVLEFGIRVQNMFE